MKTSTEKELRVIAGMRNDRHPENSISWKAAEEIRELKKALGEISAEISKQDHSYLIAYIDRIKERLSLEPTT